MYLKLSDCFVVVLLRSLTRALGARLRKKSNGQSSANSVDLLVTGCEVRRILGVGLLTLGVLEDNVVAEGSGICGAEVYVRGA